MKWLGDDLPKDAFANVRYAVFGCGNSDWAATYQSVPRFIDEQLSKHGARRSTPAAKAMRSDLDGQFQKWFPAAAQVATKEFGHRLEFHPHRGGRTALCDRAVRGPPSTPSWPTGGAVAMKVLVNDELQNKSGANPSERSTRHIEVQLPSNITYASAII